MVSHVYPFSLRHRNNNKEEKLGDISIKGKSPILNGERPEGPGDPGFKVSPTRLKKKMEMEAELKKIKKNKLAKGRK